MGWLATARFAGAVVCAASLVLSGCSRDEFAAAFDKASKGVRQVLRGESPDAKQAGAKKKKGKRTHFVEAAPVTIGALRLSSVYTGTLRSRRTVRIFTQEEGRLVELPYFEGDAVSAGAMLLTLDGALLTVQVAKAVAVRKEAEANVKRLQRLRAGKMVPEEEYLRSTTAVEIARAEEALLRTRLGYTKVSAPFTGVITARLVEPGDIVPKHTHVLTLIDPASIIIDLDVSEILLAHVEEGAKVNVRIDALGDHVYPGRVVRVHPTLNPRTRQGHVEISLDPVPAEARPGQFARATFAVEALARKTVPFAALRRDPKGEYVMRLDGEQRAQRIEVRSGRRVADRVEIVEGLEQGDTVVIRGFLGLEPGTTVTVAKSPEQRAVAVQ